MLWEKSQRVKGRQNETPTVEGEQDVCGESVDTWFLVHTYLDA